MVEKLRKFIDRISIDKFGKDILEKSNLKSKSYARSGG